MFQKKKTTILQNFFSIENLSQNIHTQMVAISLLSILFNKKKNNETV